MLHLKSVNTSPSLLLLVATFVALLTGCRTDAGSDDQASTDVVSVEDLTGCDLGPELCWEGDDLDAMHRFGQARVELVMGGAPGTAVQTMYAQAQRLQHRMNDEERALLEALQPVMDQIGEDHDLAFDVAAELQRGPMARLFAQSYTAATVEVVQHFVDPDAPLPVASLEPDGDGLGSSRQAMEEGEQASAESDAATWRDQLGHVSGPDHPVFEESMQMLIESGPIGAAFIGWFKMFPDLLTTDYAVVIARRWGEYDETTGEIVPSGVSREAKVQEIIDRYEWATGKVGAAVGLFSAVPFAGVAAIPGETIYLWHLELRMAFEIAAVYGWDIRKDAQLFSVISWVMVGVLAKESAYVFARYMALPAIVDRILGPVGRGKKPCFESDAWKGRERLLMRISGTPLLLLINNLFTENGQRWLLRSARSFTRKALLGQFVPILGAAVNITVGIAANMINTNITARRVQTRSRQWLADLMENGTAYLTNPRPFRCMMKALGSVAWADGELSDREKKLFMGFLAKPYAVDETTTIHRTSEEMRDQAAMLASVPDRHRDHDDEVDDCLDDFESSHPRNREALLAHLYGMTVIDGLPDEATLDRYDDIVADLDGSGWNDGEEIDDSRLNYIEAYILALLHPSTIDEIEDPDIRTLMAAVAPENLMGYMNVPDPAVQAAFDCGFSGACN